MAGCQSEMTCSPDHNHPCGYPPSHLASEFHFKKSLTHVNKPMCSNEYEVIRSDITPQMEIQDAISKMTVTKIIWDLFYGKLNIGGGERKVRVTL